MSASEGAPRLLLLHGPNLNALGRRDPVHYPRTTLRQLENQVSVWADGLGLALRAYQSNHEGELIDRIQDAHAWASGAVVNLGAFTHSSYALHDALLDFEHPVIEVHLSAISSRESWRQNSVIRPACFAHVEGRGVDGYKAALELMARKLGLAGTSNSPE